VKRNKSFTLIELLVVVAIIAMLVGMLLPTLARARESVRRAACASNLREIGQAMHQYAQVNGDAYPKLQQPANIIGTGAGFFNTAPVVEDNPQNEPNPVNPAPKPVSSNLWLLCRGQLSTPPVFLCPSQSRKAGIDITELMRETDGKKRGAKYFSDFPTHPTAGPMISYSFQMPWSTNWNSLSPGPGFILGGDENNGADVMVRWNASANPKCWESSTGTGRASEKKVIQAANSTNHKSEGQNVLDSTAAAVFKQDVHCGLSQDNIYTSGRSSLNMTGNAPMRNPKEDAGMRDVKPIDVVFPQSDIPDTVLVPIMSSILGNWTCKTTPP